jgi:hypothetical protein
VRLQLATSSAEQTVLILGAGASLAEAVFHRPRRDGEHPPLDKTFFLRTARRVRRGRVTSERTRLLARVVDRAAALGEPDLCGSLRPVRLEDHLGRLFFELNTSATAMNIESYYDLIRLYNSELVTTTNWMTGRDGVIKRLIQWGLRDGQVSLITFNHDLLIENALARLPDSRYSGAWCFKHVYGLPDMDTISDESEQYDKDCSGNRGRHVPIFKMHGSCNWVYRTRKRYPSAQVARGDRTLVLWTNKKLSQATSMGWSKGRSSWHMWPLIVPPVYEKHSYITGDLRSIWNSAAVALTDATRVVFWGYSFPRADLHARYFFSSIAQHNSALKRPVLINPDPQSQDELWSVLQPRQVEHYRDIEAFLANLG